MPKLIVTYSLLALTFLIAPRTQAAEVCAVSSNLVQNCGFETGDFSGWTLLGDTVHAGVDAFDARSGAFGAYLAGLGSIAANDTNFTDLQQVLTTTAGATYTLSYSSAHFTNADVTPDNVFAASIDNNLIAGSFQLNVGNLGYTVAAPFTFTANSSATTLDFLAEDANFYFSLDDVSVIPGTSPVPEPGSLFLFSSTAAALFFFRRRADARGSE